MKRHSTSQKASPEKNRLASTVPVKITPPRLGACYLREGLFQNLDHYRDKPALWISGPAGSGKTMLAASYLQERKIAYLWYQVDARDADPATLFYYLGLAAKHHAPRRREFLPLLTSEYLGGISAFARNFFEALFKRLKPPFALVLDNYQEVTGEALLHQIVDDLLAVVPNGGQVMLISRSQPPQSLGRMQVHQQMVLLDWRQLQLGVEDVQALSGIVQTAPLTLPEAKAVQAATMGWAAGVVLMLVQPQTKVQSIDKDALWAPEAVFDYFAAEIFAKLDDTTRNFLVKTAFLSQVGAAMATALTGHKQTGRILANLARKNYFTLQHSSRPPLLYQYHPLFKAFLQGQAHALLKPDDLRQLKARTADILIENNQYEEAAVFLASIENWKPFTQLIIHQAQTMVEQGRSGTLHKWINRLPEAIRSKTPWLMYWEGICLMAVDLVACRARLEDAFNLFKDRKDPAGFYLAWSGIVETYVYEWADMAPLDRWIDEIEALLESYPQFASPQIEAKVTSAVFCALIYRRLDHPDIGLWEERVNEMILNTCNIHLQFGLGSHLIIYYSWMIGEQDKAKFLVGFLKQALSKKADIAPLYQITWHSINGIFLWMTNHFQESHDAFTRGLAIAEREGIHFWDFMLLANLTHCSLCQGNIKEAQAYLDQMTFILGTQRKLDIAHYYYLEAGKALCLANPALALEHINKCSDLAKEGSSLFIKFIFSAGKADVLIELEEYDRADHYIEAALHHGRKMNSNNSEYRCAWLRALFNFKQKNDEAGYFYLRKYLSISKACKTVNHTWWRSSVMEPLFRKALEADIEVDHVRRLIREHAIAPPVSGDHVKHWPYCLKVYTLGSFSVLVDHRPLSYNHRRQNKPLTLLKAIIAFGGRQVREEQLWEALWPDAEGDAAHVAFTTTLHRLRKLIDCEQAITLQGRQVSLDAHRCWVDTWCLEALLSTLPATNLLPEADTVNLPHSAEQIFHLYQGHFLAGENAPWLLGARERLRTRMVRQINAMAHQCRAQKHWPSAIAIYERGLVIDPLLESFYLGLMQCFIKLKRFAEALATYKRCRKILNEVLKVRPCSDIESLRRQLRD